MSYTLQLFQNRAVNVITMFWVWGFFPFCKGEGSFPIELAALHVLFFLLFETTSVWGQGGNQQEALMRLKEELSKAGLS